MRNKIVEISHWLSLGEQLDRRVDDVLGSWEGTPYLSQHRIKAMGVDCYEIAAAFLDEMERKPRGSTVLPKLPPGIANNRPDMAARAIRVIVEAYEGLESLVDGSVETGDILVVRNTLRNDGPAHEGHSMIAGSEPYSVLHAVSPRVCWTTCAGREIIKVYRAKAKHRWT